MLHRVLERSYRRHGASYLPRTILIQGLLVCPVISGAVAVLSAYAPMSSAQYLRLSLLGCALQVTYALISQRVVNELARPVTRWVGGTRDLQQTAVAWRAAASLPWKFVRRTFSASVLGVSLAVLYLVWVAYFATQVNLAFVSALLESST